MIREIAKVRRLSLLVTLVAFAGCGAEPPSPGAESGVEESAYDGLSPEEIEREASSMTLEEAERLGIVDSTIRIEVPTSPDSLLILPLDTGG